MNMFKYLKICLAAALLAVGLAGCGVSKADYQAYTDYDYSFDTVIALKGYCASQQAFDSYFAEMSNLFSGYHKMFDRYNDYDGVSNIKTINDNAGIKAVTVDDAIIEVLQDARQYYQATGGQFDCTMGAVIDTWSDFRDAVANGGTKVSVPTYDQLSKLYVKDGWQYVTIDATAKTVYISDPRVKLDVGALAKGFATQKVAEKLRADGLTSGFISAGGNVVLLGPKPNGDTWSVGIANPASTASSLDIYLTSASISLVTSGTYQRFVTYNGKDYHHIIDPTTLMPGTLYTSVTIVGPDSTVCDILSTSLFLLSISAGRKLLETMGLQDVGVIWVQSKTQADKTQSGYWSGDYWIIATENVLPNMKSQQS